MKNNKEFVATLGKLLDIVDDSQQRKDSQPLSFSDLRNKPVSTRTDEQENARNLTRQRRSLRIQANSYLSTGKDIPHNLQTQIDAANEQAELLKRKSDR